MSRARKGRTALIRSLLKALIVNGKIVTTKAKAKAIQGQADILVTLVRKNTLSGRRRAVAFLGNDRKVSDFLFSKLVPSFKERESGFTRMILLPRRRGDQAEMVSLEWVEKYIEPTLPKESKKAKEKSVRVKKSGGKKEVVKNAKVKKEKKTGK